MLVARSRGERAFVMMLPIIAAAFAQDAGFQTHAWVLFFVLAIATLILLNRIEFGDAKMIPLKTNGGASTAAPAAAVTVVVDIPIVCTCRLIRS